MRPTHAPLFDRCPERCSSLNVAPAHAPTLRRTNYRMNWKTCSVEAGDGIGKRRDPQRLPTSSRCFRRTSFVSSMLRSNIPRGETVEQTPFQTPFSGMQKHGLTMFAKTCYSSLVPRVHPGLLCAVVRLCECACTESLQWSYREMRFRMKQVRKLSSLKRSCGAFHPFADGYAGQG
jgi:hypothetical protein